MFELTGENRALFRRVKFMLYAKIFTGQAFRQVRSVLWPDIHNEGSLSELIGKVWEEERTGMIQNNTNRGYDYEPSAQPTPQEARKVCYYASPVIL
jgi:hypothetical protein